MSLSYLFLEKNALNNRLLPSLIKGLGEFEEIFCFKHHMFMKNLFRKFSIDVNSMILVAEN